MECDPRARARVELATFSKGKGVDCVSQLEQRRGTGDVMQPRSSVSAPQRDGSESLIEETELGLSLGGEKAQQRGASPRVKERPLGAFVQKKNLGQGIGMGPNPELSFGLSCLTKAQGTLVGSEGSFRRLEGAAQTLPSVERVSQRMEGTPRELQISVEDVRLVLEQRNPQVFDALGAIIMNDALLEEAARFTGQIPSVLSLGGVGFFSSTPSSSLPSDGKGLGPLVCWEDSRSFSMDGDAVELGPLRIVQLDGSEV